jgi:hypothetical protein
MNRPYRPSSGTEGAAFEDTYCCRCEEYGEPRAAGVLDCKLGILTAAFVYEKDEPEYPQEWQYVQGVPTCTAFRRVAS